jgi:transcriptional regulator with XRE-family HTH domain
MDKIKTGKFLTELRKGKGITQNELAMNLHVTPQAVSKWESGDSMPDISTLELLSSFYQVSIDELVAGEKKSNLVVIADKKRKSIFTNPGFILFCINMWFFLLCFAIAGFNFLQIKIITSSACSNENGICTTITYLLLNLYELLFRCSGGPVVPLWLFVLCGFFGRVLSIGVWLFQGKWKIVSLISEFICHLASFTFLFIVGTVDSELVAKEGWAIMTIHEIIFLLVFVVIVIWHFRYFFPKKTKANPQK